MKLYHYKLIHYLPNKLLIVQYNNIANYLSTNNNYTDDLTMRYISKYSNLDLIRYIRYLFAELNLRHLEIKKNEVNIFYNNHLNNLPDALLNEHKVFENHHTLRYMIQCYFILENIYNLDYNHEIFESDEEFGELKEYVRKNLEHELF